MRAETHWWVCNLHSVGTFVLDVDVDDEEEEEIEKRTPTVYFYIVQEIENRNENLTKFSITSGENTDSSKRTGVGSNVTKCLCVCMFGVFYVKFLFLFSYRFASKYFFLDIFALLALTILALHAISTCTFHKIISKRFLLWFFFLFPKIQGSDWAQFWFLPSNTCLQKILSFFLLKKSNLIN